MLVHALNINIYQSNLPEKIDAIIANAKYEISKSDIRHEIRSNHKMTEKVLKELEEEGLIYLETSGKKTLVKITSAGVFHLRKWNRFYLELYSEQLKDHYKYVGYPEWLTEAGPGEVQ